MFLCPVDLALAVATIFSSSTGNELNEESDEKSVKDAANGICTDRIVDCSVATFEASKSTTNAQKMKPKKKQQKMEGAGKRSRTNEKRKYGCETKDTVTVHAKKHEDSTAAASKRQRRSSVGTFICFCSSFVQVCNQHDPCPVQATGHRIM
jgi:hypothetical protein